MCCNSMRCMQLLCGAKEYGLKVDVWSAGMFLVDLCSEGMPFRCATEIQMLIQIVGLLGMAK